MKPKTPPTHPAARPPLPLLSLLFGLLFWRRGRRAQRLQRCLRALSVCTRVEPGPVGQSFRGAQLARLPCLDRAEGRRWELRQC